MILWYNFAKDQYDSYSGCNYNVDNSYKCWSSEQWRTKSSAASVIPKNWVKRNSFHLPSNILSAGSTFPSAISCIRMCTWSLIKITKSHINLKERAGRARKLRKEIEGKMVGWGLSMCKQQKIRINIALIAWISSWQLKKETN